MLTRDFSSPRRVSRRLFTEARGGLRGARGSRASDAGRRTGAPQPVIPAGIPGGIPAGPSAGFTLVELLVALFLLAVGIMGIAQVFAFSSRHTSYARVETIAINLAQEIREKMLSETFHDLESIFDGVDTDDPETVPLPASGWAENLATNLGPHARGTIEIFNSEEDPDLTTAMLRILVTISWSERGRIVSIPFDFAVARTSS